MNQNEIATPLSSQIYKLHSPILIEFDGDFGSYSFNGTGSRNDPYLIEGYNITSTGSLSNAIDIRNTNVFFIINSCLLYTDYTGVRLNHVASGTSLIIGNRIFSLTEDGGGMYVRNMQNCTITKNICNNFIQGIHLDAADDCIILDNYIQNIFQEGINIRNSDSNTIIFNRIKNAKEHGIALVVGSSYNVVHHNILEGNSWSDTYNIDGEPKGKPTSQGYDEGSQNTWYDVESSQGNTWSDYFGIGPYHIDGTANAFDLYPNHTTGLTPFIIIIITIPILIGLVLVIYQFYYKKRKMKRL